MPLIQPTRKADTCMSGQAKPKALPIWFFSLWGLPRDMSPNLGVSSYLTFSP